MDWPISVGRLQLGRLEASLRGGFAIRSAVAKIQGTQLAEATKKPVRLGQTGRLFAPSREGVETGAGILLAIDRGADNGAGDGDADHLHRPKSKSPASHRHGASRLPPCQYIRGQGIMEIIVALDGDDFVNCKSRAPTTSGCSPETQPGAIQERPRSRRTSFSIGLPPAESQWPKTPSRTASKIASSGGRLA